MLNNFLTKIAVGKSNTDYPDILERRIEIKEPFPDLSKEWLALVESSLMKSDWWNQTLILLDIQTVSLLLPNQKYVQNVGN